jgi:hypothetical protein
MKKHKFRNQKYGCCQLITAINARIFLGKGDITEKKFESLVDLAKCRYGGALNINDCYKELGLVTKEIEWSIQSIASNLPVGVGYYDDQLGLHSALIYDVEGSLFSMANSSKCKQEFSEIKIPPPHLALFLSFSLF